MKRLLVISLAGVLLSVGACAKPSGRFDVWGTVTFKGRPAVPAGLIVINPDFSKGNDGPQGVAQIRDGRFDTRTLAKGAPSGPVILLIDGFDGAALPDAPDGRPLFTGYKTSMDLPKQPTETNIEVPASAATKSKTAPTPLP